MEREEGNGDSTGACSRVVSNFPVSPSIRGKSFSESSKVREALVAWCGGDTLPEPFAWDAERRFQIRCELDALYFHLYQIARDDVAYILETFPIVKRKDMQQYGEYRTKRVILEMYDREA